MELFELRIYPEPTDAYEENGAFIIVADKVTLKEADEILGDYQEYPIEKGEVVAVSPADGKRYFAPRDGFGWMDVTKVGEI
jgi:hypothetical protein